MSKAYYTTADVSRLCGVHISTAIRWVNEGKLRAARTPGGVRRISPPALAAFMREHGYPPPEEFERPPGVLSGASVQPPRQARAVDPSGPDDRLLEAIVETAPLCLQVVDREGWTVRINKSLRQTFGVEEDDLVGVGKHNFFTDRKLVAGGVAAAVERAFEGEIVTLPLADFSSGNQLSPVDDRDLIIRAKAFPIATGGEVRYVGIVYEDITEKAVLQRDLVAKNTELEYFVYTVAHDLKSPLGVIQSCAQMLLELEPEGEVAGRAEMIRRNAERMREFINSILSFSKAGKWESEGHACPTKAIVSNIFMQLRNRYPEQEIRLAADELPDVNLHPDAAAQLFQNLVENAHKYRSPQRTPEISVEYSSGRGFHRFAVRDNGIGIAPEEREKIFDAFYRPAGAPKSGSGVGLAIVRRIVEGAGGKIWVESAPGRGSSLCFTLPKSN